MYSKDQRVVLTLDAGGTNFVFSAIQGGKEIVAPINLPSVPNDKEKCLQQLVKGFTMVQESLPVSASAISFAFPGPADYLHGVIGDLPNFPAFRGGVALGPFLSEKFNLPVYINNDGNLYAYGEALFGMLPSVNQYLNEHGSKRTYRNLIGLTFGTGFGCGVVLDRTLLTGDNGCGGDVWLMRNPKNPTLIAEENVSIRAVKRMYHELCGADVTELSPKDIYDIAEGTREGNQEAAKRSFYQLGEVAGDAIVQALDIVDGLVVIVGGLSGASKYIMPGIMAEVRSQFKNVEGNCFSCLQSEVYDLTNAEDVEKFTDDGRKEVAVPFSEKVTDYFYERKVGISFSTIGTNQAIAVGAYAFALNELDRA